MSRGIRHVTQGKDAMDSNGVFAEDVRWEVVPDEYGDASWLEQEGLGFEDRLAAYQRREFGLVGVQAVCTLNIPNGNGYILNEIRSPGLWSIESDSDESYFAEIGEEEIFQLKEMLKELGAKVRA